MPVQAYIVVDNKPYRSDMAYEWGLSIYIKNEYNVLFDTGASSEVLLNNLEKLEIDPKSIDAVVISHAHMDHAGGLKGLDKVVKKGTPLYYPSNTIKFFKPENLKIKYTRESMEIFPDIWLSEYPSILAIERGLVVKGTHNYLFIGCSHGGVITHVEKARQLFGNIYGVIGGFHISTKYEGVNTANELNRYDVKFIATLHCTETRAVEGLKEYFKGKIDTGGSGKIINLD